MLVLFVFVVACIGAAVAGLAIVYTLVPLDWLQASSDVVGAYLQTVGTVYAVLLAFVVFVVWSQFNEAEQHVHDEANNLLDMSRVVSAMHDPVRGTARDALREYARAILDEDWAEMSRGNPCLRAWSRLEHLFATFQGLEPRSDRESAVLAEALTRFNDLSDARADRIRSAQTRIPLILWALLVSGAFVVVGSMYLFPLRHFGLHALITGALAGCIGHMLYVVYDLDNCFQGYWRVTRTPYERVLRQICAP